MAHVHWLLKWRLCSGSRDLQAQVGAQAAPGVLGKSPLFHVQVVVWSAVHLLKTREKVGPALGAPEQLLDSNLRHRK